MISFKSAQQNKNNHVSIIVITLEKSKFKTSRDFKHKKYWRLDHSHQSGNSK